MPGGGHVVRRTRAEFLVVTRVQALLGDSVVGSHVRYNWSAGHDSDIVAAFRPECAWNMRPVSSILFIFALLLFSEP